MSMIKISCPSCKSALKIAEEKLTETQGRVVCHECQHIFRLVKKSKKNPPPAKTSPASAKPEFNDIDSPERDFRLPDDDFQEPELAPKKSAKPNIRTELPPLHYRVPKAEAKTPFAEVNQQNPIAFNLLDYKTANQHIPQVNINPPTTTGNGENADTKNNITIHTGSLVFTLMGDGQANASSTLPAENNQFNEVPMSNQQAIAMLTAATSTRSELNWTIATFAALMILMVQLFYLVLMMS